MLRPGVTLYFLRHGETDWNRVQRYQGQTDIPLNDTGRAQAKRNGTTLASVLGPKAADLDFVSSPLVRASETMRIARTELGLPATAFRSDARLKEINFGHWEGQLWSELPQLDPQGFRERMADTWNWQPEGGESYASVTARVATWLAEIERDTLAVSHGVVSRVLRGLELGVANAEIHDLTVPQDKVLVLREGRQEWL